MDDCEMVQKFQEKVKQKDNASPRATTEVDLEEKHTKLRGFAENLREEYYESYRQMTEQLRLESFFEIGNILCRSIYKFTYI